MHLISRYISRVFIARTCEYLFIHKSYMHICIDAVCQCICVLHTYASGNNNSTFKMFMFSVYISANMWPPWRRSDDNCSFDRLIDKQTITKKTIKKHDSLRSLAVQVNSTIDVTYSQYSQQIINQMPQSICLLRSTQQSAAVTKPITPKSHQTMFCFYPFRLGSVGLWLGVAQRNVLRVFG